MRTSILMLVILSIMFCSCDEPLSQLEATDNEAIYNVILVDNYRVGDLEIIPSDIPDTTSYIENPDTANILYWHKIEQTEEDFDIVISDQPVETEVGSFYQAEATYMKTWSGIFNIIRYNNNADSLERFSKDFALTGIREAICLKMGSTNQRRGWVLTSIGDAEFISPAAEPRFLDYLYYFSGSSSDSIFDFGSRSLNDLICFNTGEEVTITFDLLGDLDELIMHEPTDNYYYQLSEPQPDPSGGYRVVFNMPSVRLNGQLKFLVINVGDISEDYLARGFCYNYKTQ